MNLIYKLIIGTLFISSAYSEEVSYKEKKSMASLVAQNVCDLNSIYTPEYSYSLPRGVLESFLSGEAFDNPVKYSEEERARLEGDINNIFQNIMSLNPVKDKVAVISAGAPGAGKTTLLRQKLERNSESGTNFAYVCPDDVCLKGQTSTYVADVEKGDGSFTAREACYTKWRPGSNAGAHLLLANLIKEKYSFYFGTTCSSPMTYKFFEHLKEQGYKIHVVHVSAPNGVRWNSIQERDKEFIQTTQEDTRVKGLDVPQRINDTFLKYADRIDFYYRSAVFEDAELAATWDRNEDGVGGKMDIVDGAAYEGVKAVHNAAMDTLCNPELKWEEVIKHKVQR